MVVFDHSKPTRKNTPICKVPDPRTLPFSTETPVMLCRRGTQDLGLRHPHTQQQRKQHETAAALAVSKDRGWFLDLTLERTKTSQLITSQTSRKLGLLHLSTNKKTKWWQMHPFWHIFFIYMNHRLHRLPMTTAASSIIPS